MKYVTYVLVRSTGSSEFVTATSDFQALKEAVRLLTHKGKGGLRKNGELIATFKNGSITLC